MIDITTIQIGDKLRFISDKEEITVWSIDHALRFDMTHADLINEDIGIHQLEYIPEYPSKRFDDLTVEKYKNGEIEISINNVDGNASFILTPEIIKDLVNYLNKPYNEYIDI